MNYNTENTTCRNCQATMPEHSLYCPKCSQKNTDGRIPILAFVKDALESIFNIDSKFLKTSFGLFIPGKLTNEFFKGKHKSFATPSRLFIASAILFFAMVSLVFQKETKYEKFNGDFLDIGKTAKNKQEQLAQLDKVKEQMGDNEAMLSILDSAKIQIQNSKVDTSITNITLWHKNYKILTSDFEELSQDSLIKKYKIDGIFDQMILKQGLKSKDNPKSLVLFLIGNFTWMLLLLIPSLALIFKLLFIRRQKFYVEHLVFLFHTHAFVLLVGALLLMLKYLEVFDMPSETIPLSMLGLAIYTLIAMKVVYKQSWFKTLTKAFVIFISYFILLPLCLAVISTLSFLLF